jgi:NitT/TauT family transport system permease protein
MFRPLVAWIDGLRFEQDTSGHSPRSWALNVMKRSRLISAITRTFYALVRWASWAMPIGSPGSHRPAAIRRAGDRVWFGVMLVVLALALWHVLRELLLQTSLAEAIAVIGWALLTMLRVFVLIALASLIWVPVGVWVGLRPRVMEIVQPIAQFLAAFPANLLFPVAVYGIVTWRLNPDVWLSPLMVLGTQWYILFNVIAGASTIPGELRYAARNFQLSGALWWRTVALPAVFPYYVTGAITASGGSWNASIVAELANWRHTQVKAHGLGSYIAEATAAGDFHRVVLGIATMSVFVVAINRVFWRPLYYYAERRFRLG